MEPDTESGDAVNVVRVGSVPSGNCIGMLISSQYQALGVPFPPGKACTPSKTG
jgi:hypothetical protein